MEDITLRKIFNFKGTIRSAFDLLINEYDGLGFTLKTDLRTNSSAESTFSNTIRNYRSKGIITPVEKSGVKLILTGRNILQYLLVQRLLAVGARIANLIKILPDLDDDQLIGLTQRDTLSLTDVPNLPEKHYRQHTSTNITVSSTMPVFYQIRLTTGIQVNINANKYSVDDVEKIRTAFKTALDDLE